MMAGENARLRSDLEDAMAGAGTLLSAADRLCVACVELLHVDGAAISLMHRHGTQGTFGSSGELSRRLDEYQFTFGEGPCLDAFEIGRPILVADVAAEDENRWPAFTAAVIGEGVRAVFALPASVGTTHFGVLDLFRITPGPLSRGDLSGGLMAAELAALPLLNLMNSDVDWADGEVTSASSQLASLERVEVYQATGILMEQLGVGPAEALVRLRAHAFSSGQTASEVAWAIVEKRLVLGNDESGMDPDESGTTS